MKKRFIVIALILIASFLVYLSLNVDKKEESSNEKDLKVVNLKAEYAINVYDIKTVVGFADYYFIAKVVKKRDTTYRHKVPDENNQGTKMIGPPYTKYDVHIIKNIKGELPSDISIVKLGGISEDKKTIILYKDDILLEVGKTYEFSACAQKNGELLVSGPKSSNEVNVDDGFEKYEKIYKNEIPYKRKRFKYKPTN